MWRRAVVSVALLAAMATTCYAKVLVVVNAEPDDTAYPEGYRGMQNRMNMAILSTLDQFGVDYKVVPASSAKTEFLRTGQMVWNFGTAAAVAEQFDGVISLSPGAKTASERPFPRSYTGCYPCSLTLGGATKAPLVPQLWLFGAMNGASNSGGQVGGTRFVNSGGAAPCSTGVSMGPLAGAGDYGAAMPAGSLGANPVLRYSPVTGTTWFSNANSNGYYPYAGTTGGVRSLLKNYQMYHYGRYRFTGIESNNPDSLDTGAGADTTVMWERLFKGLYAGANNTLPIKPIVFANVMGASPCYDSLGAVMPCEYDPQITLLALARLDSLTNGGVFKRVKKAAIVISGAFERTIRRLPGGANNQDSTVIKATLDSLATLGVPLTVGVNADSIASYPNELAWWKKLPSAKFSPYTTYGVNDTTKGGNWSSSRIVDLFGRYRLRALAGDSTFHYVAGADSSVLYGLVTLRSRLKDAGLPLSGTVIAPLDDWSPKNLLYKDTPSDSLALVFRRAGFSAALVDVQRPEGSVFRISGNKDLVRGYQGMQRAYRNRLTGDEFKFIGHTGYNITGSSIQYFPAPTDSAAVPIGFVFGGSGPSTPTASLQMLGRFWSGFLNDVWRDVDWFPREGIPDRAGYLDVRYSSADVFNDCRRASVLKLHVSDLGGIPNGPPARPGYWAIKSLVNQFRAVNAWANRKVLILTYPEDCEP